MKVQKLQMIMERLEATRVSTTPVLVPCSQSEWKELVESPAYEHIAKRYTSAIAQIDTWLALSEEEKLENYATRPFESNSLSGANRKPKAVCLVVKVEKGFEVCVFEPAGEWVVHEITSDKEAEFVGQHGMYSLCDFGTGWLDIWYMNDKVPAHTMESEMLFGELTIGCYTSGESLGWLTNQLGE